MIRLPHLSTRTYTLLPYTSLFRSVAILRRYGDAHGIDAATTPPAVYQKHARTSECALPSGKRQKQQTLTELFNFGCPKEIGRAHVRTPVTNATVDYRLKLEKKTK